MWDRHWRQQPTHREPPPTRASWGAVREHATDLYDRACRTVIVVPNAKNWLHYSLITVTFSAMEMRTLELAKVVCHEIPLAVKTTPIRQPTGLLDPEKEASRQMQDLLDPYLMEPTHGVLSSPVVLVKKKDGS